MIYAGTDFNGESIKVLQATVLPVLTDENPGTVLDDNLSVIYLNFI